MERKVGEIFEYNGEWYQCLKSPDGSCKHCDMGFGGKCPIPIKECTESGRNDRSYIIFKKLEKVGYPTMLDGKLVQKILTTDRYSCNGCCFESSGCDKADNDLCCEHEIYVEIKQNKEDMEEEKLNLKKFDLEAAKAGKPVCTRDGRKARIICFDRNWEYPIVALIECENGEEMISACDKDGKARIYETQGTDLMMLPEKKEGWIIIHKEAIYDKETAEKIARETTANVIRIQKIEWEE